MAAYYYDILQALKTRIKGVVGSIPVTVRKRPVYLTGDALPSIVISPDDTSGESVEYLAFCKDTTYEYPVTVAVFTAGNRVEDIETSAYLDLRQNIRNEIYQPSLTGAATVYDTNLDLGGSYIQVEQRSNYDIMTFRVRFKSLEQRL